MAHHNDTGRSGEALAVDFLVEKGYTIIEQNWKHRRWEIDVIASKQDILHFIEVKTRRTENFGQPEESVNTIKITHMLNAADEYLFLHPEWKKIQLDILSVKMLKNEPVAYFFIEDVYL